MARRPKGGLSQDSAFHVWSKPPILVEAAHKLDEARPRLAETNQDLAETTPKVFNTMSKLVPTSTGFAELASNMGLFRLASPQNQPAGSE